MVVACILFLTLTEKSLNQNVPSDHLTILDDINLVMVVNGVQWQLSPNLDSVYVYGVTGQESTTIPFTSDAGVVEAVVKINTWSTSPVGELGHHSIEVARLCWGSLVIQYQGVSTTFPEIVDSEGQKIGYWSMPII